MRHFMKFLELYRQPNQSGSVIGERQNCISDIKGIWKVLNKWLEATRKIFNKSSSKIQVGLNVIYMYVTGKIFQNLLKAASLPAQLMNFEACYFEYIKKISFNMVKVSNAPLYFLYQKALSDTIYKLHTVISSFSEFENLLNEIMKTLDIIFPLVIQVQ